MIPTFDPTDTRLFTFVSSVAPNAAPTFAVKKGASVLTSLTSVASDATHYYSLYTMPNTPGYYVAEWTALKTFSGSARQFVSRLVFQVKETTTLV
jgi:hypothetical protein